MALQAIESAVRFLNRLTEVLAGIFEAIRAFIVGNLTLVAGWLVVLTATALLGPYVGHRLRRSSETHDAHLVDLKRVVLLPMLEYLTDSVIPILQRRLGNVGIGLRMIPQPTVGVMNWSAVTEETFCYEEAGGPPLSHSPDVAVDERLPALFDSPLYRDARIHFRHIFRLLDMLMQDFREHNTACIRYAHRLQSEVAQSVSLPESDGSLQQHRWMRSNRLALVLFYRQLGLPRTPPFFRRQDQDMHSLEGAGFGMVRGTAEDVDRSIAALDEVAARRDGAKRLIAQADAVGDRALIVRAEIEGSLHGRRLRGRCEYLA